MDEQRDGWKPQRVFSHRFNFSILLILSLLVLPSCRADEVDSVRSELALPLDANVLYLEEVMPPCVPLWDSSHDPCPVEVPTDVEINSVEGSIPTWTDILLGEENVIAIHLVVRGEAKIDTTRCEFYPRRLDSFWHNMVSDTNIIDFMENSGLDYHCYMEIGVKEYIVGSGPPLLTVSMHREPIGWWALDFNDWPDAQKDKWIKELLDDPQSRVATAYEGKELVLFLGTSTTIAVESFEVGPQAGLWFVQKDGDEIRAVAQDIEYARTEEQHSRLDLPLNDLIEQVKRADTERTTLTDGRIGVAPYDLPALVTDANHLCDYYVSVGAVYDDSEEATVLPPPVPEEGDIVSTPADG